MSSANVLISYFSEKIKQTLLSNLKGGFVFYFLIIGCIIYLNPILVEYILERFMDEEKIGTLS